MGWGGDGRWWGWWGGGEGLRVEAANTGKGELTLTLLFPFNKDPSDELWGCSACDIVRFSQDFTALCWPDLFAS